MGDFLSPNKKDVYERFRRRIELYRRHQNGKSSRFEPSASGLNEQHRRETLLLRQKWLDSKAKKAPRSRSRSENNSGEHRNSNTSVSTCSCSLCTSITGPLDYQRPTFYTRLL